MCDDRLSAAPSAAVAPQTPPVCRETPPDAAPTLDDIITKRRALWADGQDGARDRAFVRAAAVKILSTPALRRAVREKPYRLIEAAFCIVDKERRTVPFFLNEVQRDFLARLEEYGTSRPFFILKGRQQGFTSLITAVQLAFAIVRRNFSGFTMSHRADGTRAIFSDKAKAVYDRLPDELKPTEKYNNAYELSFSRLGSSWRVATAGDDVGRGMTMNFVHFSEVAFYECSLAELQAGIGETLTPNAIRIYETTANGWGGAKDLWDSGSCVNLFYVWWRSAEYRLTDPAAVARALSSLDGWLRPRLALLRSRGLDDGQCAWYADKYASYLDKRMIRQEYPVTADEAFLSTGDCVFDKEAIHNRLLALAGAPAPRRGRFTFRRVGVPLSDGAGETRDMAWSLCDIAFREEPDGIIALHEEPRVRRDARGTVTATAPYVLGGDTAGCGEDFFTGKVIDNLTGRTAATLRCRRMDEDDYAEQMLCLARYYHDALIAVETNYSRYPVRVLRRKYGYTNLYVREREDGQTGARERVDGFETTTRTKPIIIAELAEEMRRDPAAESDPETLREMAVFLRHPDGRLAAASGAHDDLVMALAIAHHASAQGARTWQSLAPVTSDPLARCFAPDERPDGAFIEW